MNNSIEKNELMKMCSERGIVKLKTTFSFRNINQKLRKVGIQCTSIKQKDWTNKNQEKVKRCKNIIFNKGRKKLLDLGNSMRKREENRIICFA